MTIFRVRIFQIGVILASIFLAWSAPSVAAQQAILSGVRVSKKPGAPSGTALGTVEGRVRKMSRHAVEAWAASGGHAALILADPEGAGGNRSCGLRYYQVEAGRYRELGRVRFCRATFQETVLRDGSPVFILSGVDPQAGKPRLVVLGVYGIHGRLAGVRSPRIEGQSLIYQDVASRRMEAVALRALAGRDMSGVYVVTPAGAGKPAYVQFMRDGRLVLLDAANQLHSGWWWTDGRVMHARMADGTQRDWAHGSLPAATAVPAGTRLELRLLEPLSSRAARRGHAVKAVLISPVIVGGHILVPQGSNFLGTITEVRAVGWGLRHETASLTVDFTAVRLPDGRELAIHSRLWGVENSREKVDETGAIHGIRSTGTYGYSAEDKISSVAMADPIAYLFAQSASTALLGFAEPEILYRAGTELSIELTAPLVTPEVYPPRVRPFSASARERARLLELIRTLPFRTRTEKRGKPSDITNLVFVGSTAGLRRAFQAAGWVAAQQLTASSGFQTAKSLSGTHTYHEAPMSVLLLEGSRPILALSKSTNTFAARHHLRIYDTRRHFDGTEVLTASATQDIGVAVSRKQRTVIHVIDPYIDNERSKVVDDLVFTGCVDGVSLVPRPWVPRQAYNATGDRLLTDGSAAVLRINSCSHPRHTPAAAATRPPAVERVGRDSALILRNDLWRGNLVYQGVAGAVKLYRHRNPGSDLAANWGAWRASDALVNEPRDGGPESLHEPSSFAPVNPSSPSARSPLIESARTSQPWEAPRYEIALSGGFLGFPAKNLEYLGLSMDSSKPGLPGYTLGIFEHVGNGWSLGASATLNTWRHVSNEFGYFFQSGEYRLEGYAIQGANEQVGTAAGQAGLATRQFEYNLLISPAARGSRWRPYAAVGPALQLISLEGVPLKKPSGPFRLGLRNAGLLKAAFDFGSTPPLDGGGIFQPGLEYGGGIEFRLHPRIALRADFRETWSATPAIIRDSYQNYLPAYLGPSYDTTTVREKPGENFFQQRLTLGIAYTF